MLGHPLNLLDIRPAPAGGALSGCPQGSRVGRESAVTRQPLAARPELSNVAIKSRRAATLTRAVACAPIIERCGDIPSTSKTPHHRSLIGVDLTSRGQICLNATAGRRGLSGRLSLRPTVNLTVSNTRLPADLLLPTRPIELLTLSTAASINQQPAWSHSAELLPRSAAPLTKLSRRRQLAVSGSSCSRRPL